MPITAPQTEEFRSFARNVEYARDMIKTGEGLGALQVGALDIRDLYRAAWVQAVSAVDHWLHEELFRRVAGLAADTDADLPVQLSKFELPLSVVEAVRRGEQTMADAVVEQVRSRWTYLPLHNTRKISEAYRLVTDDKLWVRVAKQLNAWNRGRTTYTEQHVKTEFARVIERRNKIAHYADLEDGDLDRRRAITAGEANDAVDYLERVVLAIATVLG